MVLLIAASLQGQNPSDNSDPAGPPPPSSIPAKQWLAAATQQEAVGKVRKLHGNAWVESSTLLFQADEIEWNEETGDVKATGHIYVHDFRAKQELWCEALEYNTDTEKGVFHGVKGKYLPRIVPRQGVLTGTSPFYFEGEWAERNGDLYTIHNGFFTNCAMPKPTWRLKTPKFVYEPEQKAVAYKARFVLKGVPIFFAPYYYHPLEEETRKSGFLTPNIAHSSQRGMVLGLGYYWAINRSYDATYRMAYYTARGTGHQIDLRGKPSANSDFYAILYGVQDRGRQGSSPPDTYSGFSVFAEGKADLGKGWSAHMNVNYLSSFRFRQEWAQSFNEQVASEFKSVGYLNKNFGGRMLNIVFERLQNFQSAEVRKVDPATGDVSYIPNAVTIRRMPEVEFSGREEPFWSKLPAWLSFESSSGLLYRSYAIFDSSQTNLLDHFNTADFAHRFNLAPRVSTAIRVGALHLVPSFTLHETYYSEGQEQYASYYRATGTNIVRSARDFTLDLIFPSLERIYDKKTFLGDKLKHVIEPRATYRYVTGVGSGFDDFIRFDDRDILSDTSELLVGVTNRLYAKSGDSVQEVLTWDLAQKRYFDPTFGGALIAGRRNVFESESDFSAYAFLLGARGTSPVISRLRITPVGRLSASWEADYDPRLHRIVNSTLSLDYRYKDYFVSLGNNAVHSDPAVSASANQYRYRAGVGDPNRRGWNAGVEGIYDYREAIILHSTIQVTYNTDCCGFSVQYRRLHAGLRDETQWRVAFSVANIGTFGSLRRQDRLF